MRPRAYLLLPLLIPLIGALLAANASAASTAAHAERPMVFMLAGQSNMEGRGFPIPAERSDPRILRQGDVGAPWTVARDPLNGMGVGPGLSFAKELLKRDPRARIVLVPCAKGSTNILMWQRGGPLYTDCVKRMRDAIRRGGIAKGILFDQGESDTYTSARALRWPRLYRRMVRAMRRSLSAPRLPVVHAVIASNQAPATFPFWDAVKRQQRRHLNRRDVAVETDDLPIGGFPHYSVPGYRMLGRRMARAWLRA